MINDGIISTYRGASATVLRNGATVGFRLTAFDELNPIIKSPAITGAIVGAISTVLNNPVDVIKSRMQASTIKSYSILSDLRKEIKLRGISFLFTTGLSVSFLPD